MLKISVPPLKSRKIIPSIAVRRDVWRGAYYLKYAGTKFDHS